MIVDGEDVTALGVTPDDADPMNPVLRWHRTIPVDVAPGGSWVVVAAHGAYQLDPVYGDRFAFGVADPIFLRR